MSRWIRHAIPRLCRQSFASSFRGAHTDDRDPGQPVILSAAPAAVHPKPRRLRECAPDQGRCDRNFHRHWELPFWADRRPTMDGHPGTRRCQPRRWPDAAASGGHSESGRIIGRGPAGAGHGKKLKKWKEFDRESLTRAGECAIITITARQPALNFSGENRL